MSSEIDLQHVLPAWLELASKTDVSLGLDAAEAFRRAERLLNGLRTGQTWTKSWAPGADQIEVLHAIVALVCREGADPRAALSDLELAFDFISALPWGTEEFGGPRELLASCAFQAWSVARRFSRAPEIEKWLVHLADSHTVALARHALEVPRHERFEHALELRLEDPELLLHVSEILRFRLEAAPALVKNEAEFFYAFLEKPFRSIGAYDDREFFLGAFALTAGCASRKLFRIDEANVWLQRAEGNLALTQNPRMYFARIEYQRLAVATELRSVNVLERSLELAEKFRSLGMPEDALKCRFMEGSAHYEAGDVERATAVSRQICEEAENLKSWGLLAQALGNLAAYCARSGDGPGALVYLDKAARMLTDAGNRVAQVRLLGSMSEIFRKSGEIEAALDVLQRAGTEASMLGLRGDLVEIRLMCADLLIGAGRDDEAEREIHAALPIIDEEKMVPHGIAALSLLRDSLRRRQIDHGALRDLHRHLKDRSR